MHMVWQQAIRPDFHLVRSTPLRGAEERLRPPIPPLRDMMEDRWRDNLMERLGVRQRVVVGGRVATERKNLVRAEAYCRFLKPTSALRTPVLNLL